MSTVPSHSPMPPDDVLDPDADADAGADLGPLRSSFWAKPKVASGLGIAASVLVHVVLLVLGVLLIPAVRQAVGNLTAKQEQTIVPIAELATKQAGGIPNPGMTDDRSRAAGQNVDSSVTQSDAWGQKQSATLDRQLMSGSTGDAPAAIGIGRGKSGESKSQGLTASVAGGGLAKFGVPGGGSGIGPRGAVFGNGGNAYRIAFVCDGTGDMVGNYAFAILLKELRATVSVLKPKQQFSIIFFYGDTKYAAVDPQKLLPAIPANFDRMEKFLNAFSGGSGTDPRPAIDFAFSLKPDLVYFLSNGAFDKLATYTEVRQQFRTANAKNTARVNTILFSNPSDAERKNDNDIQSQRDAEKAMKDIAKDNGGKYSAVDPTAIYTAPQ